MERHLLIASFKLRFRVLHKSTVCTLHCHAQSAKQYAWFIQGVCNLTGSRMEIQEAADVGAAPPHRILLLLRTLGTERGWRMCGSLSSLLCEFGRSRSRTQCHRTRWDYPFRLCGLGLPWWQIICFVNDFSNIVNTWHYLNWSWVAFTILQASNLKSLKFFQSF